jgi:hypothetical protein
MRAQQHRERLRERFELVREAERAAPAHRIRVAQHDLGDQGLDPVADRLERARARSPASANRRSLLVQPSASTSRFGGSADTSSTKPSIRSSCDTRT